MCCIFNCYIFLWFVILLTNYFFHFIFHSFALHSIYSRYLYILFSNAIQSSSYIIFSFFLYFPLLYQVYIKHNSLGDDIPIVVVLKAMGLECDEEIVQLVGTEPEILDLFSGSLEEPYYLGIYSQDQVSVSVFYSCVSIDMCFF